MEQKHILLAGAGRAEVNIDKNCLPLDGFTFVHDPLHVRALVLDGERRIAIVSVEITSIFDETRALFTRTVRELTGAAEDDVWLCLTHSFAGPHIWTAGAKGPKRTSEELARSQRLEQAYLAALKEAVAAAMDSRREALISSAIGQCAVNASRNVETEDGWWIGIDLDQPCDHSLPVLRIDGADGTHIAMVFVYGMRSCVMTKVRDSAGNKGVSSDLCGAASSWLEAEMGGDFTAIYLCGPAGDQEPALQGSLTALETQTERLGASALRAWNEASCLAAPTIQSCTADIACATKKMNRDLRSLRPTRETSFEPDGVKNLRVHALRLGGLHLVGVQPEINGVTACQISEALPGDNVAVAVMVNGCDKCMPEQEAYELVKYQCLNSPYMPGSAEILRDAAVSLIHQMKEVTV